MYWRTEGENTDPKNQNQDFQRKEDVAWERMEKTAGNGSCKTNCELSHIVNHIVSSTSTQVIAEKRNSENWTVFGLFYIITIRKEKEKKPKCTSKLHVKAQCTWGVSNWINDVKKPCYCIDTLMITARTWTN